MIKKVKTKELKPGMYVHEIARNWLNHPFLENSIKIENEQVIKKIASHGIEEVLIDTARGLDVEGPLPVKGEKIDFRKKADDVDVIDFKHEPEVIRPVSIYDEVDKAKKIKKESMKTVQRVMNDVISGGKVEKAAVVEVVDNIMDSVLRNQDALMGLGRLRKTDEYTYTHSMGTCVLMVSFGRMLGLAPDKIRDAGVGALLHDIGKTRIPVNILNKVGRLSAAEFEIVKGHAEYTRIILEETVDINDTTMRTACEHHERLDGSGYPGKLNKDDISLFGQAMAIVDVYDAVTSDRCYQRKIQPTQALSLLYEWSGQYFDAELVQKFIRCVGIYPVGSLVRLDSGLLGVVVSHCEESLMQPVLRIVFDTKKNNYVTFPYDIDISNPSSNGGGDRIIGYEDPDRWNLLPESYLQ